MTARRTGALVAVLAVLLLVAFVALRRPPAPVGTAPSGAASGTAAGTPPSVSPPPPAGGDRPVIVPGLPGEPAATMDGSALRDAATPRYTALDVWFVRMMIPHHGQALEMAALAPQRAADPRVRALAERVRSAQGPEIGVLESWLDARGLPREVAGHDHATMRGMQSAAALRRLADARGADFDRLFVQMMGAHHRGAVEMARDLLRVGVDRTLREFADAVVAEQRVEIVRMGELLDD
ncbi:DUF305 domain-containing protein [Micromonospora sp. WMMA1923]|uniref:DUF305 domain-containing protein n=1 Tax=Micromonospora sp. WMMA1923 TaxID=3404125 RepID=UPI003B961E79